MKVNELVVFAGRIDILRSWWHPSIRDQEPDQEIKPPGCSSSKMIADSSLDAFSFLRFNNVRNLVS